MEIPKAAEDVEPISIYLFNIESNQSAIQLLFDHHAYALGSVITIMTIYDVLGLRISVF